MLDWQIFCLWSICLHKIFIWWLLYHEVAICWYLRFRLQIYFLSISVVSFTFQIVQSTKTVFMANTLWSNNEWSRLCSVWNNICNITCPSADCRHAEVALYILKCKVGPSFICLVMSAMLIWTYSYVSYSSSSFFFLPDLLAWHCVNSWAVNFNFSSELLRKLSLNIASFKQ